jgi:hypothetical protein
VTEQGFEAKPPLRHGVFSHGVGLTPDETEVWVAAFSLDGRHVYAPTGEIVDVATKKVIGSSSTRPGRS